MGRVRARIWRTPNNLWQPDRHGGVNGFTRRSSPCVEPENSKSEKIVGTVCGGRHQARRKKYGRGAFLSDVCGQRAGHYSALAAEGTARKPGFGHQIAVPKRRYQRKSGAAIWRDCLRTGQPYPTVDGRTGGSDDTGLPRRFSRLS